MLTSEGLLSRWNGLPEQNGGFTRVDSVHPLELYIGYEGNAQRVLLVISQTEPVQLPSSKSVEVQVRQRQDGRWAALFRLVRKEQEEVYLQLCYDLIESSRHQTMGRKGELYLFDRYKRWHRLMERQADGLLSESSRKGLIGELLFLHEVLSKGMNPRNAVAGWMGPEQGDRDFVYPSGWYEIKAVGSAAVTVSISSLEQLDAPPPGELAVYLLDRTAPGDGSGVSLNSMVNQVREKVGADPDAKELFETKLTFDFGYLFHPEYDSPLYRLSGLRRYTVDEVFPRLTKDSVPAHVVKAKYDLSLSSLEEWRSE